VWMAMAAISGGGYPVDEACADGQKLYFSREGKGQGHLAGGTIIVNHGRWWRLTRGEERGQIIMHEHR
jgi:hypothetical protein